MSSLIPTLAAFAAVASAWYAYKSRAIASKAVEEAKAQNAIASKAVEEAKAQNAIAQIEKRIDIFTRLAIFAEVVRGLGAGYPEDEMWAFARYVHLSKYYFSHEIYTEFERIFQFAHANRSLLTDDGKISPEANTANINLRDDCYKLGRKVDLYIASSNGQGGLRSSGSG